MLGWGQTFFSFERVDPFSSYQVLGCWWCICFPSVLSRLRGHHLRLFLPGAPDFTESVAFFEASPLYNTIYPLSFVWLIDDGAVAEPRIDILNVGTVDEHID